MREFIAALRQLRRPIVLIAVATLVLQTLVAGLSFAHAARMAADGTAAGVICHGNGDEGTPPAGPAAHDCCTFHTAVDPATPAPGSVLLARLALVRGAALPAARSDPQRPPRAIRAGPSQAPPTS